MFKGSLQVHTRAEEAWSGDNSCMGVHGLSGAFQPFAPGGALVFAHHQPNLAQGLPRAGALAAPYSPSDSSTLQNRVFFQLRVAGNTWVWSMWCVSSLVVPTVVSSLIGKRFDPCPCGLHLQPDKLETWAPVLLCTDNSNCSNKGVLGKAMKDKDGKAMKDKDVTLDLPGKGTLKRRGISEEKKLKLKFYKCHFVSRQVMLWPSRLDSCQALLLWCLLRVVPMFISVRELIFGLFLGIYLHSVWNTFTFLKLCCLSD